MSTTKRPRPRQSDAHSAATLPPVKKARLSNSDTPTTSRLSFLTDERQRAGKKLQATPVKDVRQASANRPDESAVVVSEVVQDEDMPDALGGDEHSDDSSEEDASDAESDSLESTEDANVNGGSSKPSHLSNGTSGHEREEESDNEENDAQLVATAGDSHQGQDARSQSPIAVEEPSFGDMLRAAHPDTIDVQAAFPTAASTSLNPAAGDKVLQAPSATSLGTVLTQALRTNDKELLESCFQVTDQSTIRSTIQRLQSSFVASLLQSLAERLHRKPGRAGLLMVWVQWSLVAHGGYLAGQPQVMRRLKSLSQVVRERANGLRPLLVLKGKLDMLGAQIELRKNMQAASQGTQFDSDEEAGVIYVEGQEEDSELDASSSEEEEDGIGQQALGSRKKSKSLNDIIQISDSSDSEDDDIPMANGLANGVEDESSEMEDGEGLIDDEAEETSDDEAEGSSDAESEDEMDEEDETSASEEEAPPARRPKSQTRSRR